jgi:Tol biopolymer transport system component
MPVIGRFPTHPTSEPKMGERTRKNTTKSRMDTMKPVGSKTIRSALCSGLFFSLLLTFFACGGGDNNNSSTPPTVVEPVKVSGTPTFGGLRLADAFAWAPDSSRIAYIARQTSNSQELYSSTPDGSVNSAVAPVPLPSGGEVFSFLWSPDLSVTDRIAYIADQVDLNVNELYSSAPDGSDNQNLSGALEDGGYVLDSYDWALSTLDPDTLVFRARKESASVTELFVSFDNGATIIKLSDTMTPGGNVLDFAVSPDGRTVAYLADQDVDGTDELYTVPIRGGAVVNISQLAPANRPNVLEFKWAPNGNRIAYRAKDLFTGLTGGNIVLFTNDPSGNSLAPVSIAPSLGQDVREFAWSPDSLQLAYTANVSGFSEQLDLFTTSPIISNNIKLTSSLPNFTDVNNIAWSPNSLLISYLADVRVIDINELFVVDPSNPPVGAPVPISGTLITGGQVVEYAWSPDSDLIAYRADQIVDDQFELFIGTPIGNRLPILISRLTLGGSDVKDFAWSPDLRASNRIAYLADQDIVGVFELYSASPNGSSSVNISGGLTAGEEVIDFAWAPDATLIAYQSNQDDITKFELYTTLP